MPATPPRTATHRLVGLQINEGSLVDQGDNPEAHIVFFKRKPQETTMPAPAPSTTPAHKLGGWRSLLEWAGIAKKKPASTTTTTAEKDYYDGPRTLAQILAADRFNEEICKLRWAFMDSVRSIMSSADPTSIAPLMQKSVAEFGVLAQQLVADLKKRHPEATDAAANAEKFVDILARLTAQANAHAETAKAAPSKPDDEAARLLFVKTLAELEAFELPFNPAPQETEMPADTNATKSLEDIVKALPEAERTQLAKELADLKAAAAAAKASPAAPAPAPAPATGGDDVQKQLADLQKQAADAKAEVAKLRDEKAYEGFVAKAKDIGAGDVQEVATLLKGAYGRSAEEGASLEKVLRAQAAQLAKAQSILTKTLGSSNNAAAGSLDEKIGEAVKAIQKAKPTLTYEQAYAEAIIANPEAYEASLDGADTD